MFRQTVRDADLFLIDLGILKGEPLFKGEGTEVGL
jgi:hypothetical protein